DERRKVAADRADLVLEVDERGVALGRAVELDDLRDREALLERRPDVRAQAVADRDSDVVVRVVGARRQVQQIAAELAEVLERGRAVAPDVAPELARAELPPERDRRARGQRRADDHHAAGTVVERERAVARVVGPKLERDRAAVAGQQELEVAEARGLR